MPDGTRDVTRLTKYFGIKLPNLQMLILLLVILGAVTGILSELILHGSLNLASNLTYGASAGITIIALPAILTAILLKAMDRKLHFKHAVVVVFAITMFYVLFVIISALIFRFTNNALLAFVVLLLGDGGIYGYYFIINRVALNQGKRRILVTAAVQPILNMLLYIPVSASLLAISVPLGIMIIKLWVAMFIFMLCGYTILYILDRPAKKNLNSSGVEFMSGMINQWLYGINKSYELFQGSGVKKNLPLRILALKGKSGYKAIFAKPEIHYGPMAGIGGATTTEYLGRHVVDVYAAAPFILHGAVNLEDNPISSEQSKEIWRHMQNELGAMEKARSFSRARGTMATGYQKPCRAISIEIGDFRMLSLTKAPLVTEDMDNEVGAELERILSRKVDNVMLIDAHNSRFENASADELRGIYKGSRYIRTYASAISQLSRKLGSSRKQELLFGCSYELLKKKLPHKDIGPGYLSIGVFGFGSRKFCMLYFDANNMLPSMRGAIRTHILKKYGMDSEVCTTDTHAVNTLALNASNVLGRYTTPTQLLPLLDRLVSEAIGDMEKVSYAYSRTMINDFKVWGRGSEDLIFQISRDTIRAGKRYVPFIIAGFFIIAAWAIYLI